MENKVLRRPKAKIAKIEDLTSKDIKLLTMAYSLLDDSFMCFGKSYFRLEELGLISDENQITFMGRKMVWELSQEIKAKKELQ